jgi:superfamily I DNA/RNA helicase
MLISEIDWLKDQHPMSESDYLNLDRRGRGFGLNVDQRKKIWQSIISYQQILAQSNEIDWGDIPRRLWQFIKDGTISLPTYDFIFIDEAQFFAPIWVTLIQKALNPQNSHLFLVADPTQGFLGRKTTWKSIGLNARGRSHQLRRSYRTTLEILKFATLFYRLRLPNENDEDILKPDLINMSSTGTIPQIISLDSSQDEITRVANEVAEFVKKGYPKKDLLLLHANGQGVNALIEAINTRIDKNAAIDPKDTYPGNYVRVTTINAGAGLESPIVFLVGLRELFEEEQSLRLSDDEREDLIQENTRKIYMACTRAGQRLVFTYVGDLPDVLKNIINQN